MKKILYTLAMLLSLGSTLCIEKAAAQDYVIRNDTDAPIVLDLNLNAAECGERVEIEMPSTADETLTRHSSPKSWEGKARTVIGDTSREYAYSGERKTNGKR